MYTNAYIPRNINVNSHFIKAIRGKSIKTSKIMTSSKNYTTSKHQRIDQVPNVNIIGFKIKNISGSYSSSKHITWQIADPRGFNYHISNYNAYKLIQDCTIINGEIQEPCIWLCQNNQYILLPVTDPEIEKYRELTTIRDNTINIKDIKPGYCVMFTNGLTATYYGKYTPIRSVLSTNKKSDGQRVFVRMLKCDRNSTHVFRIHHQQMFHNNMSSYIMMYARPKISRIIEATELRHKEAEKKINELALNEMIEKYDRTIVEDIIGFASGRVRDKDLQYELVKISGSQIDINNIKGPILAKIPGNDNVLYYQNINSYGFNTLTKCYANFQNWVDAGYCELFIDSEPQIIIKKDELEWYKPYAKYRNPHTQNLLSIMPL